MGRTVRKQPTDPRNHGLKEPVKVIIRSESIDLSVLNRTGGKVPVRAIIDVFNKALQQHEEQGHRIVQEPFIDSYSYGALRLWFQYEYDNAHYAAEKETYDTAITTYDKQVADFLQAEEEAKKNPPGLTEKIERTKQRLANLEAVRDGKPIPFPTINPWEST